MVTKGYGFTVDDIDWSCPAELEPYVKSYKLKKNVEDAERWQLGQYILAAISTLGKGEYPKEPAFQIKEERKIKGNKESQEEIAVFEMKQRINALRETGLPESPA